MVFLWVLTHKFWDGGRGVLALCLGMFLHFALTQWTRSLTVGLLRRCVLTAVLGMLSVVWYSLGGQVTEEEMEREVHEQILAKEKRGKLFGLIKPKSREA